MTSLEQQDLAGRDLECVCSAKLTEAAKYIGSKHAIILSLLSSVVNDVYEDQMSELRYNRMNYVFRPYLLVIDYRVF